MISDNMSASCTPLDVAEAEKTALKVQESMSNLVVNVDLTSIQYDLDQMMVIADELGFEQEELDAIAVNLKDPKCNQGVCSLKYADFKKMDKMYNGAPLLNAIGDKMKCHPLIKDNVPKVQFFWRFWPFTWLMAECIPWIELFLYCCNPLAPLFWVLGILAWFFYYPWNSFVGTFFILPYLCACYPCHYLFWTVYYLVVPP